MASVRRLNANASARGGTPDRQAVATIENGFDEIYTGVVRALEQANAVYEELSRQNLNPRTNLYTITSPFSITTQRALTLRTLALYGLLTLMMSLLLVPLACLIHHYFRREILPGTAERSAAGSRQSAVDSQQSAVSRRSRAIRREWSAGRRRIVDPAHGAAIPAGASSLYSW
jgi:hypothetical protein